jgi:hypothetical protein
MKTLFTITILIFSISTAFTQSINKQIIASSGNTTSNTTHQLTATIGEPIIGLKSNTVSINQGFLAAAIITTTLSVEELITDSSIKIYPNPIVDLVHIDIANNTGSVTATLYSITGKQVAFQKINTTRQTMNLNHLANGMYLMQLYFKETNTIKSFKIIKK